jgi:hypothetical protein
MQGDKPDDTKCVEGRINYEPFMAHEIHPLHFFSHIVEDAKGG